jgi:methionine synthase reductase
MTKIYILYGSQYGNAEAIAKHLHCLCVLKLLDVVCQTLNSVKDTNFKGCKIIIICSTTGNGNVPDGACEFWQKIKIRSLIKSYFSHVDYTVLAIGDTNFSQFCHSGKMIDRRISELDGNRFLPIKCIDDSNDPEKNIEEWMNSLFDVL